MVFLRARKTSKLHNNLKYIYIYMPLTLNLGSVFIVYPEPLCRGGVAPSICDTLANCVTINGVTWATANVACPGYFASSETDSGLYYQWNRNVAWSSTDPLKNSDGGTTWDATMPSGTSWESTNDPSPAGFHVPTQAELNTLLDTTYVTNSWVTNYNSSGINGRLFTEISTGNTLFLPAYGYRNDGSGTLLSVEINSYYCSATQYNSSSAYCVSIISTMFISMGISTRRLGYSVRPVLSDRVTINGVTWSTRNVNTPGTFTTSPFDDGMFYQWNRNVGWSSTDPMINSNGGTTWDGTVPSGTSWESTNDPSPAGFHVPTQAEFDTLLDIMYVTNSWITCSNGVNGRLFTEISTGNILFLPACGCRDYSSGALYNVGSYGYYWSDMQYSSSLACYVGCFSGSAFMGGGNRKYGYSVRPVLT
jgi:uncharacterized protein (TIGR02145 family)